MRWRILRIWLKIASVGRIPSGRFVPWPRPLPSSHGRSQRFWYRRKPPLDDSPRRSCREPPTALNRHAEDLRSGSPEQRRVYRSRTACPLCGRTVGPPEPDNRPSLHCPQCDALLWCHVQRTGDAIQLHAFPGVSPELPDIARVGSSLPLSHDVRRLIVSLRGLETVNSTFVAGLLSLRRRIESVGGTLLLREISPHIDSIIQRLNLHDLLPIESADGPHRA